LSKLTTSVERELDDSTRLAVERTRVAYERTMLAWIRTATALITFGFSVSKFSDFVHPAADKSGYLIGPNQFGLILVCIGLASLALAVKEHRQNIRDLGDRYDSKRRSMAVIVAALIAVLGILALFAMLFRV
jgi:putative membrane protein